MKLSEYLERTECINYEEYTEILHPLVDFLHHHTEPEEIGCLIIDFRKMVAHYESMMNSDMALIAPLFFTRTICALLAEIMQDNAEVVSALINCPRPNLTLPEDHPSTPENSEDNP